MAVVRLRHKPDLSSRSTSGAETNPHRTGSVSKTNFQANAPFFGVVRFLAALPKESTRKLGQQYISS